MRIALRVDDVGWTPVEIKRGNPAKQPDQGLELARRFHAALQGLPYLAGIIPAALDDAGVEWLATKPQGMTPALHGCDHGLAADGSPSEFWGLRRSEIRSRMIAGKSMLRRAGLDTEHLILPFNAWEDMLEPVCVEQGIGYVWGGGNHEVKTPGDWPTQPQPYPLGRITFVPSWRPLYAACWHQLGPDDRPLKGVLPRLLDWPGRSIITLHITWEAKCPEFEGVRWLADQIGDRVISSGEYLQ